MLRCDQNKVPIFSPHLGLSHNAAARAVIDRRALRKLFPETLFYIYGNVMRRPVAFKNRTCQSQSLLNR
jgi:hypothetical protein